MAFIRIPQPKPVDMAKIEETNIRLALFNRFDSFLPKIINGNTKQSEIQSDLSIRIEEARNETALKGKEEKILTALTEILEKVPSFEVNGKKIDAKNVKYVQKKIAEAILLDINAHHANDFLEIKLDENKITNKLALAELIKKMSEYLNPEGKAAKEFKSLLATSAFYYEKMCVKAVILRRSLSGSQLSALKKEVAEQGPGASSLFRTQSMRNMLKPQEENTPNNPPRPMSPRGSKGE